MQRFNEFYSLQVLHSEVTLVSPAQGVLTIPGPTAWASPPTASRSAGGGPTGGATGPVRFATAPVAAPPVAEKRGEAGEISNTNKISIYIYLYLNCKLSKSSNKFNTDRNLAFSMPSAHKTGSFLLLMWKLHPELPLTGCHRSSRAQTKAPASKLNSIFLQFL